MISVCVKIIRAVIALRARYFGTQWRDCERGSVTVTMGVVLSVLLGMVALGTEVTFIQFKQRQMQAVADSSALSGAVALYKGYPPNFKLESSAVAVSGGFTDGIDSTVITINNPPQKGSFAKDSGAVEVIIVQPQTLKLVGLFTQAAFDVSARAVATYDKNAKSKYCILATDTSSSTSVTVNPGAALNFENCGMAVNATGSPALSVSSGGKIDAKSITSSGSVEVSGGGQINTTGEVLEYQPAVSDPYADVDMPTMIGCLHPNPSDMPPPDNVLKQGTYCNGLTIDSKFTMEAGTYFIKSNEFSVKSGATLTGEGVTIVLTDNNNNAQYATVNIESGVTVNLSAPPTGDTAGMIFFADRDTPYGSEINIKGGKDMTLNGALYFPTMTVTYDNGGHNAENVCTQLIAWRINFDNGSRFPSDCYDTGVKPILGTGAAVVLVE